jgi:hypothetical protein
MASFRWSRTRLKGSYQTAPSHSVGTNVNSLVSFSENQHIAPSGDEWMLVHSTFWCRGFYIRTMVHSMIPFAHVDGVGLTSPETIVAQKQPDPARKVLEQLT